MKHKPIEIDIESMYRHVSKNNWLSMDPPNFLAPFLENPKIDEQLLAQARLDPEVIKRLQNSYIEEYRSRYVAA